MSRRQVAEEFGFSIGYLNSLPASELPFFKRGGKVFYERATVIAWIKGEKVGEPSAELIAPRAPRTRQKSSRGRPPKPALADPGRQGTAR
jgi:hypothetical protein